MALSAVLASESFSNEPLPYDPGWRELAGLMVVQGTDGFYSKPSGNALYYSHEGLHWMPAPVDASGLVNSIFQRLKLDDGRFYHRIGDTIFHHESDTSWQPVVPPHVFSSFSAASFNNQIHLTGYADLGDGEVFIVDSLSSDGSWSTVQLELAHKSQHRVHPTASHLVIHFSTGAWIMQGNGAWEWHDWPMWMAGVPANEIKGKGPFLVQYTGTTGSFENGDFKFLQIFARSPNGFTWEKIDTFPSIPQTNFYFYFPWFVKEAWPDNEADYLTTDGIVWDRWSNPDSNPVVRQHVQKDGYRVGLSGTGLYIHDLGAPALPAVDVQLNMHIGGLQVDWEPVSGAGYYVVQAQGAGWWRTAKVNGTSLIVEPLDHSSGYDPIQSMTVRAWAVDGYGKPGLTGLEQSADFIAGNLPFPAVPGNFVIDKSWTTRVERTLRFRPQGGTELHEVGYSLPDQGTPIKHWFYVETSSANLLTRMDGIPTCELIHVWVRGTDGVSHSDWAGPVPFMIGPDDLPCPPENPSVTLQRDPENFLDYFYLAWNRSISANNTQIRRVRMAGPLSRTHVIEGDHYEGKADMFTFFDTDYGYSFRSEDRSMFSIGGSRYSEWTDPVIVRRPPSQEEVFVMTLFDWTSLGNGAFSSPRIGNFRFMEEDKDWVMLEEGRMLCLLSVSENLDFIVYNGGPVEGWMIASDSHWPWVYSFKHGSWFWIHPSGKYAWNPLQQSWLGL